jgi:hypothetical protein
VPKWCQKAVPPDSTSLGSSGAVVRSRTPGDGSGGGGPACPPTGVPTVPSARLPPKFRIACGEERWGGAPFVASRHQVTHDGESGFGLSLVRVKVPVRGRDQLVPHEVRDAEQARAFVHEMRAPAVPEVVRGEARAVMCAEHLFRGTLQVLAEVVTPEEKNVAARSCSPWIRSLDGTAA